jgi:hypothetical protein
MDVNEIASLNIDFIISETSEKVYQLLAHGRWFSTASSTTKSGRHIANTLLKVSLNTINQSISQYFIKMR